MKGYQEERRRGDASCPLYEWKECVIEFLFTNAPLLQIDM
ncbi:hypothetical protein EVA_05987 [gut metagenome]|uniref:Uncharacterized protein n=1 Tax=gut metagenome TaxID=749906 RepID=J9GG32_9ZZZZ